MKREHWRKALLLLVLLVGIILAITYRERISASALEQWLEQFGIAAPLVFMLLYAIGTVLFLPGSVLTLAGGALFGPYWGTLYNLTGATLGATLAFLVARYLASAWVERKSAGRLRQLKEGVEHEGWRFVAFTRLVPLFPFNLLNYALGLTRIRLWHYVLTSYLCMLPGALAYTYLGYAGREAVAGDAAAIQKGIIALALLAMVAFLPRLIRLLRGAGLTPERLQQRLEAGEHLVLVDIRERYAYEQGHIPGAINIPYDQLTLRLGRMEEHRQWPMVIIDQDDGQAAEAGRFLHKLGFPHIEPLKGGIDAWCRQGLALSQE